ncbi:MAG: NAD-dependent epimerase/dehydratase family protein, partial [Eubacterium sp.]|nr:NAD-dependent epimerase/dehydratase family protein [Eubacterium sp.]
ADNIQYTLDAVDLAERLGCKRFIGAGSQAEYGVTNEILTADTAARPVTPYGIAKLAAGSLSRIACEQKGLEHIWVRVLSIYGVHDKPNTLISQLVQHALQDEPMELSGCEQTWDYLYESDAGRAFLETGRRGVAGKIYVLGSGDGRRLKSYVDELTEMVNRDYRPDFGKKPYGPAQPMHLQADIAELTEDTGWKPLVSFAEGVREMLALRKDQQE